MRLWVLVACVVFSLSAGGVAWAGNDDEVLLGNEAAVVGGAITATTDDGSGLWYNPAGLAAVDRTSVDVSASAFTLRTFTVPAFVAASTGEEAAASVTEFLTIPSALTMTRRVRPNLTLGLGVFSSQSSDLTLRESLFTETPETRWSLNVAESSSAYHAGFGLGWRISDDLRVGFSWLGSYRTVFSSGWFFGAAANEGAAAVAGGADQSSVQTVGFDIRAGLQWEPTERLRVGVSLRLPEVLLMTKQRVSDLEVDVFDPGDGETEFTFIPGDVEDTAWGVDMFRPLRVRAGVGWVGDRGRFMAEADIQHGFEADLPFGRLERELVVNARIGGRIDLRPTLSLGLGAFTDRSPEPDVDDFGATQLDFYGATVGLRWDAIHRLAEDEEVPDFALSTTIGLRYAYGTGEIGTLLIDFETDDLARFPGQSAHVHEVSLYLGSGIHF